LILRNADRILANLCGGIIALISFFICAPFAKEWITTPSMPQF
jgi:hypothetical protein